jgi:DNA ligase-1
MKINLYRAHKTNLGIWSIWFEDNVIYYSHGAVNGAINTHKEVVTQNQSGRTMTEQIDLQMKSRISRMLDKGYKHTPAEALANPTNQLGLVRPMLALGYDKVKAPNKRGARLQRKLDGHRCLIVRDGKDLIAYSRQGKLITTIQHILEPNARLFPEGVTIDGELYCHGHQLQTLASWIKRKQLETERLKFVAYDIVDKSSYSERHTELKSIFAECTKTIVVLGATPYENDTQMWNYFRECREKSFEGAMLRLEGYGYDEGGRSKSLIKLKKRHDDELKEETEFVVIDIHPSKDGWAILECKLDNGRTFRVSAPGDVPEKTRALVEKQKYIGKQVTVEYAELTADGIPFHAVATRWRIDI